MAALSRYDLAGRQVLRHREAVLAVESNEPWREVLRWGEHDVAIADRGYASAFTSKGLPDEEAFGRVARGRGVNSAAYGLWNCGRREGADPSHTVMMIAEGVGDPQPGARLSAHAVKRLYDDTVDGANPRAVAQAAKDVHLMAIGDTAELLVAPRPEDPREPLPIIAGVSIVLATVTPTQAWLTHSGHMVGLWWSKERGWRPIHRTLGVQRRLDLHQRDALAEGQRRLQPRLARIEAAMTAGQSDRERGLLGLTHFLIRTGTFLIDAVADAPRTVPLRGGLQVGDRLLLMNETTTHLLTTPEIETMGTEPRPFAAAMRAAIAAKFGLFWQHAYPLYRERRQGTTGWVNGVGQRFAAQDSAQVTGFVDRDDHTDWVSARALRARRTELPTTSREHPRRWIDGLGRVWDHATSKQPKNQIAWYHPGNVAAIIYEHGAREAAGL